MSKYTSDALLNRDESVEDTLMDYIGDVVSEPIKKPQPKAQQQIELKGSTTDMLLQLNDYKQQGLINEEQFTQMKKQILGL